MKSKTEHEKLYRDKTGSVRHVYARDVMVPSLH